MRLSRRKKYCFICTMVSTTYKFWQFVARQLRAGKPVALLVVAESAGSSPGRAGFKMAVSAEGALCGSIGGGVMEVKLVELARDRLEKGRHAPLVKRQIHNKAAPRDQSGMICSGEQTLIVLTLDPSDLKTIRTLLRALRSPMPSAMVLTADGLSVDAHFSGPASTAFDYGSTSNFRYVEQLGFQHQLFIIGGGHCALALSAVMARLDFYIRLYDDRPGLDTFEKNRFVHEKQLLSAYDRVGGHVPSGSNVYVVVMTLGYRSDAVVIRHLLDREFAYFGVLGSAAKMAALFEELRLEGVLPEKLARIHTPAGLRVNSRTPAEIAVSIAAQIISVKNGAAP